MYTPLQIALEHASVVMKNEGDCIFFQKDNTTISFRVAAENFDFTRHAQSNILHKDQMIRNPEKIAAIILSKLKCNTRIFARLCEVKKVPKSEANSFLDTYHILNSTQSAFNLGLYLKGELLALTSFSKGRKMNRLPAHQRSYELIRFCCKHGITVTGGLTRLLKHFCTEKNAGDIMTYVDKQVSDGDAFIRAGFKKHSETMPHYFLVNKTSYERIPMPVTEKVNAKDFYLTRNLGNIKLVYTPDETL